MCLNHFAVLRWIAPSVARAVKTVGGQNPFTPFVTLGLVIAISASFAAATFVLIEHPFLALRERIHYTKTSSRTRPLRRAPVIAPAGILALHYIALRGGLSAAPLASNDSTREGHGHIL